MSFKKLVLTASIITPLVFVSSAAMAEEKHGHEHEHEHQHEAEHRQHDSHVHGIAVLNLALEGDEVHIELESPAANIIGFEHAPSSEADHAALDKAVAMLKNGAKMFAFNESAHCTMEKVHVESDLMEEEQDHDKDEHENETHSDIEAVYHFECAKPGKLSQLAVELFAAFPRMEKLNVQYVIEDKQGALVLTSGSPVIKF